MSKTKIIFRSFVLFGVLFASACRSGLSGDVMEDEVEISETEFVEIESKEETERVEADVVLPPTQIFVSVFQNQNTFYYSDKILGSLSSVDNCCEGNLKDVLDEKETSISHFAVVDMDGDGLGEVVLELDNYRGFLVMRYEAGEVIGYELGYRSMHSLNREGFFHASGGADDSSKGKMFFIKDFAVADDITRYYYSDCYVKDIKVSEEIWEEVNRAIAEIEEVEWNPYTEDEIVGYIWNCPLFAESLEEIPSNKKQVYLNSLSYLMELVAEANKESYKEFYYASLEEMDKIYQLCVGKYMEKELNVLEKRQTRWQEDLDDRITEELNGRESLDEIEDEYVYARYGSIVLRRVCNLVNEYFECDFYKTPN